MDGDLGWTDPALMKEVAGCLSRRHNSRWCSRGGNPSAPPGVGRPDSHRYRVARPRSPTRCAPFDRADLETNGGMMTTRWTTMLPILGATALLLAGCGTYATASVQPAAGPPAATAPGTQPGTQAAAKPKPA